MFQGPRLRSIGSIVVIVVLSAVVGGCSGGSQGALVEPAVAGSEANYEYLIPRGAGEQIRGGAPLAILPAELDVQVGEVIRIINEDDEGHFIGIFYVGAHETVTQQFASPGEFVGNCSVHPSGQISLRVDA